jgi:S1-C subfamily serine protease
MVYNTRETPIALPGVPRRGTFRRVVTVIFIALIVGMIGGIAGSIGATHPLAMRWVPDGFYGAQQAGTEASLYQSIGGVVYGQDVPPSEPLSAVKITPQSIGTPGALPLNSAGAVFQEAGPAVVQVIISGQTRGRRTPTGSGSGVVVDERGYILTNYHVVAGANQIVVLFSTGDREVAQILGTDRGNDLALLKINLPSDIPVARLGDSDQVYVGEVAIAIGSPFGLAQTMTQGIISAVGRDWHTGSSSFQDLIQTDAPINPGNSGGPLLNANAEVIGITSMIESPIAGSVSIGFAIPINKAKVLLPQLETGAHLQRPWLGIRGMDVDQALAEEQGLTVQHGVLVTRVVANSSAAKAGIQGTSGRNTYAGDVITAFEGQRVAKLTQFIELLSQYQPDDAVRITIVRMDEMVDVDVILQAWPDA